MKDYYEHVKRSQKAYTCDDCGQPIPMHSPYKHTTRHARERVTVEGKTEDTVVATKYRLHETCTVPAELRALWQAQEDRLADWKARQEALQARLRAMGYETRPSYPDSLEVSVDALEHLLALVDKPNRKAVQEDA